MGAGKMAESEVILTRRGMICHFETRKTYERSCLEVGGWGHEV